MITRRPVDGIRTFTVLRTSCQRGIFIFGGDMNTDLDTPKDIDEALKQWERDRNELATRRTATPQGRKYEVRVVTRSS